MKIAGGKKLLVLGLAGLAGLALTIPGYSQTEPGGPNQLVAAGKPPRPMRDAIRGRSGGGPDRPEGPGAMRGPGGPGMAPHLGNLSVRALLSPKMREDLKLTDDQVAKLKQLQFDAEKKSIDSEAELRKAELDLRQALDPDGKPDRETILKQVDAVGKLRTENAKQEIAQMLDARSVLTDEQVKQAREMREDRREEMRDGRGPGAGPGGEGRPGRAMGERRERGPREERQGNDDGPGREAREGREDHQPGENAPAAPPAQ